MKEEEFRPFHEAFLRQAEAAPDVVALEFQEQRLTYRELATRSGRFATYLDGRGVGADTVVGVALERSLELIVAILGILRAGGAWVSLDPSYPARRLGYMLEDSGVDLLVTDDRGAAALPDTGVVRVDPRAGSRHLVGEPPTRVLTRENLAYVIYTSGSTGRPKGVALTHGGLVNLAQAQVRTFGVGPGKRILQFASMSFDASVFEIVMALSVGATLVLAPRAAILPGPGLADLLRRARITHVLLPPSVLATLPDTTLPDLEVLVCGGEALSEALAQRWLVGRRLFNAYGPTETTVFATVAEVHTDSGKPSIGRAIDGVHVVVLGARCEPVPVGEPGELAIGGKGVARGYLGAPRLTSERFIADRFGPEPGGRLYRTGDRVRVCPDGDLEFLGRIDDQVKLRGFRIEPDEVAASLREHPCVQDAVVVVRHDGGEDRLVAYATGTDLASVELRTFLADRLPAHLMPSVVVILAALPLSPSGKVDRAALPAPDRASAGLATQLAGPRTPTERVLTRLVSELLGVVEVGVDDDFFHLGGHSLHAGMLAARVRSELGRELPLLRIYQAPTVAAMAVLLDSLPDGQELPPIVAVRRDEPLPLAFPQERVWFLEQLAPGNLAYNAQATVRLRGPLDPATLQATLTEIVRRHEILRTRFWAVDGIPVQQPLPPMPIPLPLVDLSDLPELEREERAEDVIWAALRDPFDLDRPPLARWLLIRHTEQDHTLVHVEHHFVHDGWSFAVFLRELQAIYIAFVQRQPSPLPELPCQFADFAVWQRRWLREEVLDRYLEFWTTELAGSPQTLDLPTDRVRPAMQSFEGAALRIDLPPMLCRTLREFSRERGVTLYATMLAGFSALLHRYTGQTELLVGCAAANRRLTETEQLIGMMVNTLVLRLNTSAQPSFDELLRRVHKTTTRAYDWQDMPLDRLVNALDIIRDNSRNPLFQVAFSFHDSPVPDIDFAGLNGTILERHNGSAKTDLNIVVIPRAEQRVGQIPRDDTAPITLIWEYATDLFDETTMHHMVAHYQNLLEAALSQPGLDIGRLPMLTADEQQRLLVDYNGTAAPIPATSVPVLFEAQVGATPQAVAVVFEDTSLTYTQLNAQANRLAHVLIARGVGPEQIVALALPRSPELVVAILAVLKAGACYLPLDPDYPPARIGFMLHDAQPALLLISTQTIGCVPEATVTPQLVLDDPETMTVLDGCEDTDLTDADRTARLLPQHPAYVIYTSGSTGASKGVVVSHVGVSSLAAAQIERFEVGVHSRVLQFVSPSFDVSFGELCLGLLSGVALVMARPEQLVPGAPLLALVTRQRVTHVMLPASVLAVLPVQDGLPPAVTVVVGGEACPPELVAAWSRGRRMVNVYGPTETTVCATMSRPLSAATPMPPPIGRPIINTRVYVLDGSLQLVAPGVAGELYIGGVGLARGYLGQPGLTAQRFVADPYGPAGTRLYRTGDLVRWRAEGDLEFLGRVDDQVKIRGFRIEPGEIETVLATHPGIAQAVVIAREDHLGDKRLAAYVVAAGEGCRPESLREFLRERLPEYMVPAALVVLDALPLTPNGKLDRDALPAPEFGSARTGRAPRTPQEQLLAELFAEVLGLAGVGVDDDFFDLGGHSLLATRLIARVRATLGVELELRALFETPTVAGLTACLGDAGQARLALTVCERPDAVPLSFAQRRLWFLHQLEGPSPTYNIPLALRLSGDLDRLALHAALTDVISRHESLRTIFPQVDGVPYQQILDVQAACPRLTVTDTNETELSEVLAVAARYEFDLATQSPVRAELFALAPDEHVLLVVVHHIAGDGWSMGPLSRDLTAAYQARCEDREPGWAPLAVQYADYTLWQHRLLGNEADPDSLFTAQVAYWTKALAGLPEQLELPTDRSRPVVSSYRGDYLTVRLDAQLHRGLVGLARQGGVSVFMVLQAGLAALLSRLGAGDDIPVGSPIAGRTDQALDELVGFFVNMLVLRTDTSGDPTFGQLLARVRETALAAYEHQDVPFEYLVEVLNPTRSLAHHPLFQITLMLQNTPRANFALPGLQVFRVPAPTGTAMFDLSFDFVERQGPDGSPDGLDGKAEYASDLFDPATVETLFARWVRLLEAVVADPDRPISRVDILTTEERHRLLVDYNNTVGPVAQTCLPALFETQVAATPQAVAVVSGDTTLTYTQLNTCANRLAHTLIARGVGPERIVALALPRSADMIIAIMAVLKTGATYLPVDPDYPAARISHLLHDAQPTLLLTNTQTMECVPRDAATPGLVLDDPATITLRDGCADTDPTDTDRTTPLLPGHPAYVIYTSGSTGRPKAVVVCHHSVVNLFSSHREGVLASVVANVGGRRLRVAQTTSFSFDASWGQLLWMFAGHELHVINEVTRTDPDELVAYIARWRIDSVDATPSYVQLLVSQGLLDGGRWRPAVVVIGAEAVSEQLWDHLRSVDGVEGINFYGPTECTVDALMAWVDHSPRPVIGRPITNTWVYVLDAGLQPVPPGVAGELYIGGAGLARGYLRQPGLTAQRFVADPYGPPGTRMYRTGDLVRWNSDGNQEFVGRVDDQVKIRGFRIEPSEIETALGTHPDVAQTVVIARADRADDQRLVAYVVAADTGQVRDEQGEQDQVGEWRQLYDSLHAAESSAAFGHDFGGWDSSYDGQPIPIAHMREWREQTVARILSLHPRRVLEVGVGTGLLLSPLAPHCDTYWATDFSAPVIEVLAGHVDRHPELAGRVVLRAQPAHDTDGLPVELFDTVILNSVIQYFPTADYLIDVLTGMLRLVVPGGAVFLGDVRNLRLLRPFATAVQLHRADPSADLPTLRRAVEQTVLVEKELLVDPEFFTALQDHLADIAGVDLQIKRGRHHNELTRYRYDVVLRKHPITPLSLSHAPRLSWAHQVGGLPALGEYLTAQRPGQLRVTGVPNYRITHDAALAQALQDGSPLTDLLDHLHPNGFPTQPETADTSAALDSEAFYELGQRCGYWVGVTWSATAPDALDIVFADPTQTSPAVPIDLYTPTRATGTPLSSLTNNPIATRSAGALIASLREFLCQRLPDYMVPAAFVALGALPLTPNGKLDRDALPAPDLTPTTSDRAPHTPQEQILCELFAQVLGLDRVGVEDNFFALGGDSIISIQLVSRARKAGVVISPRDVFEHKTVAGLAAAATEVSETVPEAPDAGVGVVCLTPVMRWLCECGGPIDRVHMGVVVQAPAGLDLAGLTGLVQAVLDCHDVLRARLERSEHEGQGWVLRVGPAGSVAARECLVRVDAAGLDDEGLRGVIQTRWAAAITRLDPQAGVMIQVVWLDRGPSQPGRLVIVIHHLAIDGVSWRILLEDLASGGAQLAAGQAPVLEPCRTSFRRWTQLLTAAALDPIRSGELAVWTAMLSGAEPLLGDRALDPARDTIGEYRKTRLVLPTTQTEPLLTSVPAVFHAGVQDVLLCGLALAVASWRRQRDHDDGQGRVLVDLEGHGRQEQVATGVDLSRTLGWFTTLSPVRLDIGGIDVDQALAGGPAAGQALKRVKEQLRAIPDHGLGFGLLHHLNPQTSPILAALPGPQIAFNYLGRFPVPKPTDWAIVADPGGLGGGADPALPASHVLDINAWTEDRPDGPVLHVSWRWPAELLTEDTVQQLARGWFQALDALATHARSPDAGGHTPSDFPLARLSPPELATLTNTVRRHGGQIQEVLPLAPLQHGLLFHTLLDTHGPDVYTTQLILDLHGPLDPTALRAATHTLLDRHPHLRAGFHRTNIDRYLAVIPHQAPLPWQEADLSDQDPATQDAHAAQLLADEQAHRFDLGRPPLIRITLIRLGADRYRLALTNHHILLDGWSTPLLIQELFTLYTHAPGAAPLPPATPYRSYLAWLHAQDRAAALTAWQHALAGLEGPTLIAGPHRHPVAEIPDTCTVELSEELTTALTELAQHLGVTLNTLLQGAWAILLSRLTGRDDVVFGTAVSGRPADLPDAESLIGLFINTIPTRVPLSPSEPISHLLARLHTQHTQLLDHHHLGLVDIQHHTGLGPLFDTMTVYENYPLDSPLHHELAPGLRLTNIHSHDATHYPLALAALPGPRLTLRLDHQPHTLDTATAHAIPGRLIRILEQLATNADQPISRLDLLSPQERHQLLVEANTTTVPVSATTLPELFRQQVQATPDAVALVFADTTLTYAELNTHANRLAHALIGHGVGPEQIVALALPRGIELVVAIVAVLKAGAAYLPVDPDYPPARISFLLTDAHPTLLLSSEQTAACIPPGTTTAQLIIDYAYTAAEEGGGADNNPTDTDRTTGLLPQHPAYVIYTSGTSGTPKGVIVSHAGIPSLASAQIDRLGIGSGSRVLQFASASFDASFWELCMGLLSGAALVVAPAEQLLPGPP